MKKKPFLLALFLITATGAFCQFPGATCGSAIRLCSLDPFAVSSIPHSSSFTPGCFAGTPDDGQWYQFTVNTTGELAWNCAPTDTAIELDWAFYDITDGCPTSATSQNYVCCNYNYSGAHSNPVGMSPVSATQCPDSAVTGIASKEICPWETVMTGRTYAIFINNYSYPATTGWNFNFTGSTFGMGLSGDTFTVTPQTICATHDTVSITNYTTNAVWQLWNFGDGTTDTAANPLQHYYSQPGIYVISLSDSLPGSVCTYLSSRQVNIVSTDSLAPTIQQACPGIAVTLNAPSVTSNTFLWSTGATTQSITFNATASGAYTVTCTLAQGCSAIATTNLTVTNTPVATIACADTQICAGSNAVLTASSGNTYNWSNTGVTQAVTVTPDSTTAYTVTVTLGAGCSATASQTLVVHSQAQLQYNDTVCSGLSYFFNGQFLSQSGTYHAQLQTIWGCDSTVILNLVVDTILFPTIVQAGDSLETQNFNSYLWSLNNNTISESNTQGIAITQSGNYSVQVATANGCNGYSATGYFVFTGITEIIAGYGVKLYPNPNNGDFTVQCTDNMEHEIEITDAVGRTIVAVTKITGLKHLSLNEFADGIYFLRVLDGNQPESLKFSVVR